MTTETLGNQTYGPFPDWEMVPTPYGTWGVPAGHKMWMEMVEIWDPKEQRHVLQPWPRMERVEGYELATKPLDPSRYRTWPEQRASEDSRAAQALEKIASALGALGDKEAADAESEREG